jgi:predicted phosphodiesterase
MADWKETAAHMRFDEGKTWTEITNALRGEFPQLTETQVREKIRRAMRDTPRYKAQDNAAILVFSDMHTPFDLPGFPYFLRETAQKYGCKRAVCLGDIVDNHAITNHQVEPCALGAYTELDLAIQRLKIYSTLFPEVDLVLGNHDTRIIRQAAIVGIGERFLRGLNEVLELPDTWVLHGNEFILNGVNYSHGVNWGGKNGALNRAISERMSCCIGHSHGFGGVGFHTNSIDTIFGLNVGCGINEATYAFNYGRFAKQKSTIGCGVVFDSEAAIFVPISKNFL